MSLTIRLRQSAAAAALLGLTVTACGTEHPGQQQSRSAVPRPSFTPRPKCAQPAETPPSRSSSSPTASTTGTPREGDNEDRPPNYGDNHAYRMSVELSPAKRAKGEASAALIQYELDKARKEGDVSKKRITVALEHLGCGKQHGVYIWDGFYSVHTGDVCVSGHVTEEELTIRVHGAYAEPHPGTGPCVENRGGH
ncbi:hypothetical protein ABT025_28445 [Streptomyces sp. NPDC002809]|uniref:hypothetical protein n=1 Tax=Streptomyces sp. NPDC002809 TaxID=3154433 RepID=UPI00332A108D